jgi:hypothetical protein
MRDLTHTVNGTDLGEGAKVWGQGRGMNIGSLTLDKGHKK